MPAMMNFDLPKGQSSPIKVFGVGGGGSNAVNHMYNSGIKGVDFIVCNTDAQSLESSPVPIKLQLGASLTEGRGAGSIPEVGKNAAIETIEEVRSILEKNTAMVFITAGMGGGTGTGAAPVIAKVAKELGILTVGIVTYPFMFEGAKRASQADLGLAELREHVDTLLVIQNDKLREMYGKMSIKEAFSKADDVLAIAAKGITEVISVHGVINVDMNDVKTVMSQSGLAIMGSAKASGENRALKAIEAAIESPLLNDNDIRGAEHVLLYITFMNDEDAELDEIYEINNYIQEAAGLGANIIWGYGTDPNLDSDICVTVVATGFNKTDANKSLVNNERVVLTLEEEPAKEIESPMQSPVSHTQAEAKEEDATEPFLIKKVEPVKAPEPAPAPVAETKKPTFEFNVQMQSAPAAKEEKVEAEVQVEQQPTAQAKKVYSLDDEPEPAPKSEPKQGFFNKKPVAEPEKSVAPTNTSETKEPTENKVGASEFMRLTEERFNRIKEMNSKMKNNIADLEKEPAISRANKFKLNDQPHSSENNMSRYSLNENGELRKNNSFLFDNVD